MFKHVLNIGCSPGRKWKVFIHMKESKYDPIRISVEDENKNYKHGYICYPSVDAAMRQVEKHIPDIIWKHERRINMPGMYRISWNYKGNNMRFQTVNKDCANDVFSVLRSLGKDISNLTGEILTIDVVLDGGNKTYTYFSDFTARINQRVVVPTPDGEKEASVVSCVWRTKAALSLPIDRYSKTIRITEDNVLPF